MSLERCSEARGGTACILMEHFWNVIVEPYFGRNGWDFPGFSSSGILFLRWDHRSMYFFSGIVWRFPHKEKHAELPLFFSDRNFWDEVHHILLDMSQNPPQDSSLLGSSPLGISNLNLHHCHVGRDNLHPNLYLPRWNDAEQKQPYTGKVDQFCSRFLWRRNMLLSFWCFLARDWTKR